MASLQQSDAPTMRPWSGGDAPPIDWRGGVVRTRSGQESYPGDHGPFNWMHSGSKSDIVAYAPDLAMREIGPPCENCRKPVEVGQVVLPWDDAGEMHADCDNPFSLKVERHDGEPEPVVLLGSPMRQIPLARITATEAMTQEVEG